jgi:hypothetical protein
VTAPSYNDLGYGYRPEWHRDVIDLEQTFLRRPRHALFVAVHDEAEQLLTPGNPHYVMDEPGIFVMHPTILATGRKTGN